MANIKRGVRAEPNIGSTGGDLGLTITAKDNNLSGVSAGVSDLMAPEKRKTLIFGSLLVSKNTIDFYVSKVYFKEGVCRPSNGELTPTPREGEVVVFKDFFLAGLRFPMDPVVPSCLSLSMRSYII